MVLPPELKYTYPNGVNELLMGLTDYPNNRVIILHNITCAYCGRPFGPDVKSTKEHVIGRRFVPRGCLHGHWNVILNACDECNRIKGNLEDDISAISMLPDLNGNFAIDDPRLIAESHRKSIKSLSRRTRKTVADSREEIRLKQQISGATFTFDFTAPPQVDEERIRHLAHYHFRAFFYWLSFNENSRQGGFAQGQFYVLQTARRRLG